MSRKITALAGALVALPLAAGALYASAGGDQRAAPIRLAESDLFIELNGTDGDAGLQLKLDGEPWDEMRIIDPRGREVLDVRAGGRLVGYGLTGLLRCSLHPSKCSSADVWSATASPASASRAPSPPSTRFRSPPSRRASPRGPTASRGPRRRAGGSSAATA